MPRRLLALVLFLASPVLGHAAGLERVTYADPSRVVDLGVGLWAWPLPMDYDGDGDLDLVVSCPDKPYNGIYLFENPGAKPGELPVFLPAKRLGDGRSNITVSHVNGKPRVLVPGGELTGFLKGDLKTTKKFVIEDDRLRKSEGRIRANQWSYVDLDENGLIDLAVGQGRWADYGWDDAYDETGTWTNGPLHGLVWIVGNGGRNDSPSWTGPVPVKADGKPVDVFGMPSPNFADFDGDGDPDLLCGDFIDGFTYFRNVGVRRAPKFEAGRELLKDGPPLEMPLCMIVVTSIDWDDDGDTDLVVGQEDGRVAFLEHTGRTDAANGDMPIFEKPVFFQQRADGVKFGALVTPVGFDWDGDGDEDIVAGNTAGEIGFIENLDGKNPPSLAQPVLLEADGKPILHIAGPNGSIQGPAEAKWGYTTLDVGDWNHDGLPDLVVNDIWGKIVWYENVGTRTKPKLAAAQPIEVAWKGKPSKPSWNWWDPNGNELATQWRTTPLVVDWNEDGLNDLVMLDHEGYLALFRRERRGDDIVLLPGERIFQGGTFDRWNVQTKKDGPLRLNDGHAGKSGRRKLCLVDLDGDGDRDLLVNGRNVDLYRNEATDPKRPTFVFAGPLDSRRLAGHTTSPTTVDWDGDGTRDLLVGAEDGFLYHLSDPLGDRGIDTSNATSFGGFDVAGSGFEIDTLGNGERAFGNRTYEWYDVPESLRGWRFTRTNGGEGASILVTAERDVTVHLATAPSNAVDVTGWQPIDGLRFGYTDKNRTKLQVYRRSVRKGERLLVPQGNWTGGLVLAPPVEKVQPAGEETSKVDRPNVLFVAVDDMRVELGCYGDDLSRTPHIDRLAARGTLFERAYCQQAVCNPSRASLLTGLRPATLGIWDLPTHFRERRPDGVTLPQYFKQNAYVTRNVGKIFHNWRQDDYRGDPKSWSTPAVMHYASHGSDTPKVEGKVPPDLANVPRSERRDVPDDAYFDGRVANLAIDVLRESKADERPFFLAVGFWKPHAPFNAPDRYWRRFEASNVPLAANPRPPQDVPAIALHDSREILRGFKDRPNGRPTADEARTLRHGYRAATSYVDAQIGKVLDELDRLDLREDTVVVLWSDHGFHLGEHGLWAKTSNFELDARVPLIIATPDHTGGRRTKALVELLDLYPTLVDLCGLPAPDHLEGESLVAILDDPTGIVKKAAHTWHPRPAYPRDGEDPEAMGYSMRTDRYRYTEWRDFATGDVVARELYDHATDPAENVNVASRPDLASTVERLAGQLAETHPRGGVRSGRVPN